MSTGVQTQVGRVVWHELVSTDVEKAKSFYTELLGWEINVWKPGEFDYQMIHANGQDHGGFFPLEESGVPSHWIAHVQVEDVDETIARAEKLGGKVHMGPIDVPEVGRFAAIGDPQGGVISAYAPETQGPQAEGTFLWDEFMTDDVEGAKRFYTEVFGWTTKDMDMENGIYTIFQRGGEAQTAGLMERPPDVNAPPHWVTYLATDDVDGTVAKAEKLGGKTYAGPFDVPTIGRIAVLADPTGAVFGLFKPIPS
jgi:predicted enzyme related to lactoylglutathione lyase